MKFIRDSPKKEEGVALSQYLTHYWPAPRADGSVDHPTIYRLTNEPLSLFRRYSEGILVMSLTETPVCDFGWKALDFELMGIDGKTYSLADIQGERGSLIMFICNHCPYVKAVIDRLVDDVGELAEAGIRTIAIMSNDPAHYPEDSFANMKVFAENHGFTFPYVIDTTQEAARGYDAVCTPDFFGFNAALDLQYRGRLDSAHRGSRTGDTRRELVEAMKMVAETGKGPQRQFPSMGCSIKWTEC